MAINPKFKQKAIVFSLISLLISILFIVLFSALVHVPLNQKSLIKQVDIERTEDFLEYVPKYFETAIEDSTYETLYYLTDNMPVENFTDSFQKCLKYGKESTSSGFCAVSQENYATLETLLEDIANKAAEVYRGNCTIRVLDVVVTQDEPYRLKVYAKIKMIFQKGEDLIWHIDFDITKKVSLVGLPDPLTYELYTRTPKPISFGQDDLFSITDFDGNLSLIKKYVDNGYLFIDLNAPSYIDLLEGNIEENTYNDSTGLGINSFIPNKIELESTYVEDRSFLSLDYIRETQFNKSDLRLIDYPGLNTYLTFWVFDLTERMNVSSSDLLYAISDCDCDINGCYCT